MLDFWDWVDQEIDAHNLSYYRIEQDAGLANAAVSRPARQRSRPTLTVCHAIAQAFGLRDVDVLRRAGLIDPVAPEVEEETAILDIVRRLSPTARHHALAMLNGLSRLDSGEERREGRNPRENHNHTNRHESEEDWLKRLSSLPRGAPDGQVRALTIERFAQLANDLTMQELRRLVWLFTSFRALQTEEREPTNSVAV